MAVTTVAQFAAELNRPSAALLEQLQSAGVAKKSPDDKLTDADKERLLEFLRSAHGTSSPRPPIMRYLAAQDGQQPCKGLTQVGMATFTCIHDHRRQRLLDQVIDV